MLTKHGCTLVYGSRARNLKHIPFDSSPWAEFKSGKIISRRQKLVELQVPENWKTIGGTKLDFGVKNSNMRMIHHSNELFKLSRMTPNQRDWMRLNKVTTSCCNPIKSLSAEKSFCRCGGSRACRAERRPPRAKRARPPAKHGHRVAKTMPGLPSVAAQKQFFQRSFNWS